MTKDERLKLAADLIALAAQEGHDGEEWDMVQEAGFVIREMQQQINMQKQYYESVFEDGAKRIKKLMESL